ncbi:hypothetical protein HZA55_08745 [Candidatus Poribacteria bacterium]|nr:hypothetical protein [Candidatus Poribacteria bacterium]
MTNNNSNKNINRLKEILGIFIKYGFGDIISKFPIIKSYSLKRLTWLFQPEKSKSHTTPERLRMAFEELGPTFIKLGQSLATRDDILPEEYTIEFKKLRDQVPSFPLAEVKRIFSDELNLSVENAYKFFNPEPFAAASIAQVHEAQLFSGEKIVVKIKRPDIKSKIEADLKILYKLAKLLEKYIPETKLFDPSGIIDEFDMVIKQELDFTLEANNARTFKNNFKNSETTYIPEIHWDLTSYSIITMEYIDGVSLYDLDEINRRNYNKKKIAENGLRSFLHQTLVNGFFHADPHSSNALAIKDSRLALIDFGMVGWLDPEMMENIAMIFISLSEHNYQLLIKALHKIGMLNDSIDIIKLKHDIKNIAEPLYGRDLQHINLAEIFNGIISIAYKHQIKIPRELLLLLKALIATEGVCKELETDISILSIAKPYAENLVKSKFSPDKVGSEIKGELGEIIELLRNNPKTVDRLLNQLKDGKFKLNHDLFGFEKFSDDITKVGNRISITLLICASVLGGSMIMSSNIDVKLGIQSFSISTILGLVAYSFATLLGFWLVYLIVKSKKL